MPRGQRALPPEESAAWMSTSSDDGTCTVCGHEFNPAIVADAARPTVCPSCVAGFGPSNERAKPEVEREEFNGAESGEAVTGHTELTTLSPEYRSPLERDQAPTQRRTPLLATEPFDVERAFDDIRQLNASVVAARNDYGIKKEWASAAKKRLDKLEEDLSDLISERGQKALDAERAARQPSLEVEEVGSDAHKPAAALDGAQAPGQEEADEDGDRDEVQGEWRGQD